MPAKTMVLRAAKGSPLTNAEMDANLQSVLDYMNAQLLPTNTHSLNTYDTPGNFYQGTGGSATVEQGYPIAGGIGFLRVNTLGSATLQEYTVQTPPFRKFYRLKTGVSTWGGWRQNVQIGEGEQIPAIWIPPIYATPAFVGTDANTLVVPGSYAVASDANASAALNWPILLAGTLHVEADAAGNNQVTQKYTTRTNRTFTRVRFGSPGTWGSWLEIPNLADMMALINQAFGIGQSWQNMGAVRAPDTNYTNSTGRPIIMSVTTLLTGSNGRCISYVDNRVSQDGFNPSNGATTATLVIVPAGSVGRVVPVASSISSWWEYRT